MIYFQRKEINMSGLLSMIGMQTELDYLIGNFPACFGDTPLAIPKGNIPSDKQKCQPIGWTKLEGAIEYSFITDVDDTINYSDAIKEYTFADGTPFGIKEE